MAATTVRISPELREQIERYMIKHGFEKITQAARALIIKGLESELGES